MSRIPDLPGDPVPHKSDHESWLKQSVGRLCQLDNGRFPGSQPVSFGMKDLEKLVTYDYWVCEKSDGVRVLLFVQTDPHTKEQMVFLVDRHNSYRQLHGLFFPHYDDPRVPLRNSIIDGELVVDVDPRTKLETLRYLAFDCLVIDDQNVMSKPLDKRYGRLQAWFFKAYSKMIKDHPQVMQTQPFDIKVKDVKLSYHVDDVFNIDIPALQHGNDGLIYTCAETPYVPGTDQNILKWKPPSENSIDFRLVLRFPPTTDRPPQPDFHAKPIFELHMYCGDERGAAQYEPYDIMHVEDDEWEQLKVGGEQLDDRIVEVHWDPAHEHWRMMRFRDDKPNGNYKSVVESIIKSIADGVEKETLLARCNAIRAAWKARHGQAAAAPAPPPPAQAPPPQHHAPPPKPQPPPPQQPPQQLHAPPPPLNIAYAGPPAEAHYGPLASSSWSKVSGPATVAGMYR
ncbi:mRNA capping enzyme [Amylocystis lapponica]|nr:mRNA capping enzyme [Amylocystis lapponica]